MSLSRTPSNDHNDYTPTLIVLWFLAFITWILFGAIFKEFLQKHKKVVNVLMALFLVYAAIMIWV